MSASNNYIKSHDIPLIVLSKMGSKYISKSVQYNIEKELKDLTSSLEENFLGFTISRFYLKDADYIYIRNLSVFST